MNIPESQFHTAQENLKKFWGYSSFWPGQEKAIRAVLEGKDTVVLFPTGGGKSICYQLPATVLDGWALVISPLVALMQDQVEQLLKAGIRATFINSSIPGFEVEQRLINARNGMYSLLYLAPERLDTDLWKQMLPEMNISLVAVDEAHCISQWGHDFRPSYRTIRPALAGLPGKARWMALTATATPEVREDIIQNLQFDNPELIAGGFDRPNLQWWVTHSEQKKKKTVQSVTRGVKLGSGIVYAGTRKSCDEWAKHLSSLKIPAHAYHAGRSSEDRKGIQKGWVEGAFPVVVATNAFGMGIDKPDCRFVIHYDMPYTLEAYYQEAGRAGRDGKEAYPLLLYREGDYHRAKARLLGSYPDLKTLQELYDALCDELNLAVGSEHEHPEPVEVRSVAKRASCKPSVVHSGLKLLERLEIIEIIRQSEPRLGIRFVVSEEVLRETIQKTKPEKAEFLDLLFRQFGPLSFRQIYYLDMPYLTKKLQVNQNSLLKAIRVFSDRDQLLEYHFIDEEPMVRLLESRMATLPSTRKEVEHYRDVLLSKLEYIKGYIETEHCREVYLRQYFGETDARPCGHCDNCLVDKRKQPLDSDQLKQFRELLQKPRTVKELISLTDLPRSRVKQNLQFLIRENHIRKSDQATDAYYWVRAES
ncbi:MAG: ATP-dependent DNA helicase RecQ [Balneolaceae bacterium]